MRYLKLRFGSQTVHLTETQRQLILLALMNLAFDRPEYNAALREIAEPLERGERKARGPALGREQP